jgi:hypothetical protein
MTESVLKTVDQRQSRKPTYRLLYFRHLESQNAVRMQLSGMQIASLLGRGRESVVPSPNAKNFTVLSEQCLSSTVFVDLKWMT